MFITEGSVSINTSDPFAAPLIDPGFLTNDIDIAVVRESVRAARRFMSAPAWDGYLLQELTTASTDDELNEFIRQTAGSFFHPVSTASMSPVGAGWGVVDPDLKVKGVVGLRVVDASVAVSVDLGVVHAYWRLMISCSQVCHLHILPQRFTLLLKEPAT